MSEVDLAGLAPDKVVDARGVACPGPLLEAKKGIAGVAVGNVLELWSSDPQTKDDIGAWAGKWGTSSSVRWARTATSACSFAGRSDGSRRRQARRG